VRVVGTLSAPPVCVVVDELILECKAAQASCVWRAPATTTVPERVVAQLARGAGTGRARAHVDFCVGCATHRCAPFQGWTRVAADAGAGALLCSAA
jgi:hypothetical protein